MAELAGRIPEIARRISPEEFRELTEFLLGGPLDHSEVGQEAQFDDHTRKPTGFTRANLLLQTNWQKSGEGLTTLDDDTVELRVLYLGAAMDGKILHGGRQVASKERWQKLLRLRRRRWSEELADVGRAIRRVWLAERLITWTRDRDWDLLP